MCNHPTVKSSVKSAESNRKQKICTKPVQRWMALPRCRVSDTHGEHVQRDALTNSRRYGSKHFLCRKAKPHQNGGVHGGVRLVVMKVHLSLQAVRFLELNTGLEGAPNSILG